VSGREIRDPFEQREAIHSDDRERSRHGAVLRAEDAAEQIELVKSVTPVVCPTPPTHVHQCIASGCSPAGPSLARRRPEVVLVIDPNTDHGQASASLLLQSIDNSGVIQPDLVKDDSCRAAARCRKREQKVFGFNCRGAASAGFVDGFTDEWPKRTSQYLVPPVIHFASSGRYQPG
jgi:hypothetical protein